MSAAIQLCFISDLRDLGTRPGYVPPRRRRRGLELVRPAVRSVADLASELTREMSRTELEADAYVIAEEALQTGADRLRDVAASCLAKRARAGDEMGDFLERQAAEIVEVADLLAQASRDVERRAPQ